MIKKILYIGNFSFPLGNAAGKRVYTNGYLMRDLGYDVFYIGKSKDNNRNDYLEVKEIDGFKYYEVITSKESIKNHIFNRLYKDIMSCVEKIGIDSIGLVILYGELSNYKLNRKLMMFFQKKNIKVIIDCVEWWSEKTGNLFFRFIKNTNTKLLMNTVNNKSDGIIGISKYLTQYYSNQNLKTVLIPPMSIDEIKKDIKVKNDKEIIRFIYAGAPFRFGVGEVQIKGMKDRLDLSIDLLKLLKENNYNIVFNIYGITEEEYLNAVPRHNNLVQDSDWVFFYGRTTNKVINNEIKNSNYSILIRDKNIVTIAGFSTKISESISLGTPVITNNVGDVHLYINEQNGLLLDNDFAPFNVEKNLDHLINYIDEQRFIVFRDRNLFNVFYYKGYATQLSEFLISINE